MYSDTAGWTVMSFHYIVCIGSVIVSYYLFKKYRIEKDMLPYVSLFFFGSLILYFLTFFSAEQPAWNDWYAFGSFGLAHLRSEEHTSELQSRGHLVCRLLLEKKRRLQEMTK